VLRRTKGGDTGSRAKVILAKGEKERKEEREKDLIFGGTFYIKGKKRKRTFKMRKILQVSHARGGEGEEMGGGQGGGLFRMRHKKKKKGGQIRREGGGKVEGRN